MELFTFKRAALFGSLAIATSQFYFLQTGNAILGLFVAICLAIDEFIKAPIIVYSKFIERLGLFFANASKLARQLIFIIAIGGSILAIDKFYTINFVPFFEPLDDIIKRASVVLVFTAIFIFYATMVGSKIARIAIPRTDENLRRIELHFYLSILLLISSTFLLTIGYPMEVHIGSSGTDKANVELPIWPFEILKFLAMLVVIALIWVIATFLFILSRSSELRALKHLPYWHSAQPKPKSNGKSGN